MSGSHARYEAVVDGLLDWGLQTFVYVPSSHVAAIIAGLERNGVPGLMANREEEAAGIAGGLLLGGRRVAIVMQDNGFGNALTALTTFVKAYHLGLPIVANTRGGLGEYNAMIHTFCEAVPDLLKTAGIAAERLGPAESPALWRTTTRAVAEHAAMTHRPVVLLADVMHPGSAEA
ncbi:thiamine pyrophosphate-binding protein [Conexibacter sp. CPCC 206217]|uniref:thiamine pyrophosphate-binding protein n=1 Tax=Conexibacter sp. CPCC 206217 TaxID=3064574 RepID=UPI0027250842|nr:thiamine pyrophosphate-binding protein [Conexibacter sp. CPCC 206217]MDO8212522.1 thiamine pyrophosphate-binding protein [Conexibacter sp. CPCC 206217]